MMDKLPNAGEVYFKETHLKKKKKKGTNQSDFLFHISVFSRHPYIKKRKNPDKMNIGKKEKEKN